MSMNGLMGIKHDKDVLEDQEIFEPNTRTKRKMKAYENNQAAEGPTLDPMSPNWENIDGKWNERLFQLFVNDCKVNGDEAEVATEDLECEVQELFFNRLTRLRDLIRQSRGMDGEDEESIKRRLDLKKQYALQRQRRHTRRSQVNLQYIV
jgi:hypothetical protein